MLSLFPDCHKECNRYTDANVFPFPHIRFDRQEICPRFFVGKNGCPPTCFANGDRHRKRTPSALHNREPPFDLLRLLFGEHHKMPARHAGIEPYLRPHRERSVSGPTDRARFASLILVPPATNVRSFQSHGLMVAGGVPGFTSPASAKIHAPQWCSPAA